MTFFTRRTTSAKHGDCYLGNILDSDSADWPSEDSDLGQFLERSL